MTDTSPHNTPLPTYPQYKDTGLPWLGQIPAHWEVIRLKYLIKSKTGFAFPSNAYTNYGIPVIRIGDLINNYTVEVNDSLKLPEKFSKYLDEYGVRKGDILFAMTGGTIGKTSLYLYDRRALLNQRVGLFRIKDSTLRKIILYWLLTKYWKDYIDLHSFGGAQPNISDKEILEMPIFLPPKPEQTAIADFLDRKTTQIDQAVAQKQALIERLITYKQIIIQQAVTKGLKPNAPLKDSGVEWIGQIPAHWEVRKLKTLGYFSKGGGFSKSDLKHNGIPAILYGDIYTKYNYIVSKPVRFIDKNKSNNSVKLQYNDILFTGSGETKEDIGKNIIIKTRQDIFAGGDIIIFRPIKEYESDFICYYLNSEKVKWEKAKLSRGEIIVHIYASDLKSIIIPLPPKEELAEIVKYVAQKTNQIDRSITLQEKEIKRLQDYKTVLIDQAVTGKIKVI